jgi:hypothetical protein
MEEGQRADLRLGLVEAVRDQALRAEQIAQIGAEVVECGRAVERKVARRARRSVMLFDRCTP